jgi:hypothetical protein
MKISKFFMIYQYKVGLMSKQKENQFILTKKSSCCMHIKLTFGTASAEQTTYAFVRKADICTCREKVQADTEKRVSSALRPQSGCRQIFFICMPQIL